jgi:class 3 adenylate cyclase
MELRKSGYPEQIYREHKKQEEIRSERTINMLRLFAAIILYTNTSVNYYIRHIVSDAIHYRVSVIAILCLITVLWTWQMTKGKSLVFWFKYASVTTDILLTAACIIAVENSGTFLFTIYYLVIAMSGLRFSMPVAIYAGLLSLGSFLMTIYLMPETSKTPDMTDMIIAALMIVICATVTAVATWRSRILLMNVTRAMTDYTKAKCALARYVSNHVAEDILHRENTALLQGYRKDITILMSDLRGFTALSEKTEPEDVVKILNTYFSKMIEIIFINNGTLDKFMGDAIMVIFGAPMEDLNHVQLAVKTAIEMQEAMAGINAELQTRGLPEIRMGIGVSAGPAVVGDIGSEIRMEYTAIGKTVNLAQRLESQAGPGEILASEPVIHALDNQIIYESLPPLQVKGFSEKVNAYRITGQYQTACKTETFIPPRNEEGS